MPKLKKRTPGKVPADMERAVQQIYDDLNEIINAVNSFQLDEVGVQGKVGDIRIVQLQEDNINKYYTSNRTTNVVSISSDSLIGFPSFP